MKKRNSVTVLAADVPDTGGRGGRTTMMVVLTESVSNLNDSTSFDSAYSGITESSSKSSSSHTLQVPELMDNLLDLRRRSLSSLSENYHSGLTTIRRSSAPPPVARRASCGWGPIWELRKQFLPHKRRLSASSGEHQVGRKRNMPCLINVDPITTSD